MTAPTPTLGRQRGGEIYTVHIARAAALTFTVLLCLAAFPTKVGARAGGDVHSPVRLDGQVVTVDGPDAAPTGFTLQLRDRSVYVQVSPHAIFKAASAEAEVEGFQSGDYAIVLARRLNRGWVASQIYFDVLPLTQMPPVTVSGTVTRVGLAAHRFWLKLDSGEIRLVFIGPRTRFRIDGQLISSPPPLQTGSTVQVTMQLTRRAWMALEINIKSSQSGTRG